MADAFGLTTHQSVPVPEPHAYIDTSHSPDYREDAQNDGSSLAQLHQWATAGGDISADLEPGVLAALGARALREFKLDAASRKDWVKKAEEYLDLAAQDADDDEREPIWENASDVHYPILSTATGQFVARASPELIKGDKVVGVKVFSPPKMPDPIEQAKAGPQPQNDQEAQAAIQQLQAVKQGQDQVAQAAADRNARAERIKHFMNWLIFYKMDDWEDESDILLLQAATIGTGFKKVYMGERGLKSDFCSATCLTVHNDTKSLHNCPRITQEFQLYPNEIEERIRGGVFRNVDLAPLGGEDPEKARDFIEQHRLDDFDGDGLAEPYMVTIDKETMTVMNVVPAYMADDVVINPQTRQVMRIDRWQPFAKFSFLLDPRGHFYNIGLGQLLDTVTATIDTLLNQMIDGNTAAIAGGGFIGSGVRLQGSGQGGSLFFQPGEFKTVSSTGIDLRQAIWERTLPNQSGNSFSLLELLLAAAKDISSIKDVITGEAPSTAPVGTTLALQNQALQVFSSIYKRIYRGFKDEFRLMFRCIKRWPNDQLRKEYAEQTGGDLDQDFAGDGTDIQPVADPAVVTKMQKIAKFQTVFQVAESPLGMAAGMTQPQQAQALVKDFLDTIDYDRPERLIGDVAPNPELVAKVKETEAAAGLKQAQTAKTAAEVPKLAAQVNETDAKTHQTQADTIKAISEASHSAHAMHVIADQIQESGSLQPPNPEESDGQASASTASPA